MTTGRINQEASTRHEVFPGLGENRRLNFFSPTHSVRRPTYPIPRPSFSLPFSSLYSYELLGFPILDRHPRCTIMRGRDDCWNVPSRAPREPDFYSQRMLSIYRTLSSRRGARWRTTRNLEIPHHVLPHNSFSCGFQPGSPTAPPDPPSRAAKCV
jgi:hypothetical protein